MEKRLHDFNKTGDGEGVFPAKEKAGEKKRGR